MQGCVAISSSEAGNISLVDTAKKVMAISRVLDFYCILIRGFPQWSLLTTASVPFSLPQILSSRKTKHKDVRFQFIRDLVKQGKVVVKHVDQEADS